MEKMYCSNCNKNGHNYIKCNLPKTSYGLICFKINENQQKEYVIVRRRNSLSYVDFLRAKYNLLNYSYLQNLFNEMTIYERELILKNKFSDLWNKMWCQQKNKIIIKNKADFYKGMIKFNILKNGFINKKNGDYFSSYHFIKYCDKNYKFPEWFFPKGKREKYENDLICAKREFQEETGIDLKNIIIDTKHKLIENHIGTNGIGYRTIFYLCCINIKDIKLIKKRENKEIGDIKWATKNKIILLLRNYEKEKIKFIKKILK